MKRALLFLFEGHNDLTLTQFRKETVERAQQHAMSRGLSVHSKEYDFDYPESIKIVLGQMIVFATGYRLSNNARDPEGLKVEDTLSFRKWIVPILKDMGKEIWYGKNKPPAKPQKEEDPLSA